MRKISFRIFEEFIFGVFHRFIYGIINFSVSIRNAPTYSFKIQ